MEVMEKSTLTLRIKHLETLLLEAHDTIQRQEQEVRVLRHSMGGFGNYTGQDSMNEVAVLSTIHRCKDSTLISKQRY